MGAVSGTDREGRRSGGERRAGRRSVVLGAALALLLSAVGAAGQAPESCTYDQCALRVEHRLFGPRVVRGVAGEVVATPSLFGASLAPAVAGVDSAVAWALRSDRQRRASAVWGAVAVAGSALWFVELARSGLDGDGSDGYWAEAGFVVVLGGSVLSGWQRARSWDSMERAVWWYNRELALRAQP